MPEWKSHHMENVTKKLNVVKEERQMENHIENMPQKILIVVKEGRSVSGFPLS